MSNFLRDTYYDSVSELWIDYSKMSIPPEFFVDKQNLVEKAFADMKALEEGAIANPDENRMVGHYWLRNPEISPNAEIKKEISDTVSAIEDFTKQVHEGTIKSSSGKKYTDAVVVGIGGSNLGPMFIANALAGDNVPMNLHFIDNTDPRGIEEICKKIEPVLSSVLVIVISKSGGTIETRNGMIEMCNFFESKNVDFFKNTVCITQIGSKLHQHGEGKWLKVFPMWDFVGGRTSVLSAVGLAPLYLHGIDCKELLNGASYCDTLTRNYSNALSNPAMILALSWLYSSGGKGGSSMVMLPYKDCLELIGTYLQQLVMESIGKEHDLNNKTVNQGLAVFGNKGTTFQHSYGQQLVAGNDNFFATFISVLKDREGKDIIVGEDSTSGDYLNAFLLGSEYALTSHQKKSMTITINDVTAFTVGMLIALYERAVGFYASLIGINAYHQPAVEYGKKAASTVIEIKNSAVDFLAENKGEAFTAPVIASALGYNSPRNLFKILLHLAANDKISKVEAENFGDTSFMVK